MPLTSLRPLHDDVLLPVRLLSLLVVLLCVPTEAFFSTHSNKHIMIDLSTGNNNKMYVRFSSCPCPGAVGLTTTERPQHLGDGRQAGDDRHYRDGLSRSFKGSRSGRRAKRSAPSSPVLSTQQRPRTDAEPSPSLPLRSDYSTRHRRLFHNSRCEAAGALLTLSLPSLSPLARILSSSLLWFPSFFHSHDRHALSLVCLSEAQRASVQRTTVRKRLPPPRPEVSTLHRSPASPSTQKRLKLSVGRRRDLGARAEGLLMMAKGEDEDERS